MTWAINKAPLDAGWSDSAYNAQINPVINIKNIKYNLYFLIIKLVNLYKYF